VKDRDAVAIELHREGGARQQLVPIAQAMPGVHGDASSLGMDVLAFVNYLARGLTDYY
jgi:hypothetical protein